MNLLFSFQLEKKARLNSIILNQLNQLIVECLNKKNYRYIISGWYNRINKMQVMPNNFKNRINGKWCQNIQHWYFLLYSIQILSIWVFWYVHFKHVSLFIFIFFLARMMKTLNFQLLRLQLWLERNSSEYNLIV